MGADKVWEGIITGAAGGASAGIILASLKALHEGHPKRRDVKRVIGWLEKVSAPEGADPWRSTHAIASYTNLTEDRVRYVCSESEKIVRSSGEKETWGLLGKARDENATGVHLQKKPEESQPRARADGEDATAQP